jgi:hypothetical protein
MSSEARTMLYRFFDKSGRLLYVGVSSVGPGRWKEHSKGRSWWHEVVSSTIEHYPTRQLALLAERSAIRNERPIYNKVHNLHQSNLTSSQMRYFCSNCHREASFNFGYFHVNAAQASAVQDAWRKFDQEHQGLFSLKVLCDFENSMPRTPSWRVFCGKSGCTEPLDSPYSYEIALEDIATVSDFLAFVGHLLGKPWFEFTNFGDLLSAGSSSRCFVFPGEVRQMVTAA